MPAIEKLDSKARDYLKSFDLAAIAIACHAEEATGQSNRPTSFVADVIFHIHFGFESFGLCFDVAG